MFTPGLSGVLEVAPVGWDVWAAMLAVALTLLALDEVAKWLHRRRLA
jgi:hypothetical protein